MLTISKPLSSAQAHSYHQREFSNSQDNYYAEGERVRGEWHGKLVEQWGLKGKVPEWPRSNHPHDGTPSRMGCDFQCA